MIGIASDHAGYALKTHLSAFLSAQGHGLHDYGTYSEDSTDYPLEAQKLIKGLLEGKVSQGILICGSGIGMSMAANRHKGIRAALCITPEMAKLARQHNDANVLVLGARLISLQDAEIICNTFFQEPFEAGRHLRRIQLLDE